jgi:acyl-CoA hydrolase
MWLNTFAVDVVREPGRLDGGRIVRQLDDAAAAQAEREPSHTRRA